MISDASDKNNPAQLINLQPASATFAHKYSNLMQCFMKFAVYNKAGPNTPERHLQKVYEQKI